LISTAARLLNSGLKEVIERPRPSPDLLGASDQPSSFSFPSGHAEGALVLYGLLFYFAALYVRNIWLRLPVQAACLWVILFTGMERVYSGHHWPSDVLGGFYFGALVLTALIAFDRLALSRSRPVTYPRPAGSIAQRS
jgi:undecaprenyl-diphosphatase